MSARIDRQSELRGMHFEATLPFSWAILDALRQHAKNNPHFISAKPWWQFWDTTLVEEPICTSRECIVDEVSGIMMSSFTNGRGMTIKVFQFDVSPIVFIEFHSKMIGDAPKVLAYFKEALSKGTSDCIEQMRFPDETNLSAGNVYYTIPSRHLYVQAEYTGSRTESSYHIG